MGHSDEWLEARLGELVQIKHGWPFKSAFFSGELTGRPIVVNIGNFRYEGGFRFDSTTLKEYRGEYPSEYKLSPGEILLVMTCQTSGGEILGIPGRIPADSRVYLHNQRLGKVVVADPQRADPGYLYWLFLSPDFNRELYLSASGTKILHTAPNRIEDFRFRLPPLCEQKAIARILGALDDKIELNRRVDETLEAMARAIFKSCFVDFDPVRVKAEGRQPFGMDAETAALFPDSFQDSPLGKIPKGWELTSLREHVEARRGLSYTGEGLADAGVPMHNLDSVLEGGGYKYEGMKRYVGDYDERHIVRPGDLIVTNTEQGFDFLLIGYPALIPRCFGEFGLFSHHLYRVKPRANSPMGIFFLYWLLMSHKMRAQIIACTNGTTVNMLAPDGLERPRLALPPASLIERFDRIAGSLHARVEHNHDESRSLSRVRNVLLPKLISGEIRVKDAEQFLKEIGS